MVEYDTLLVNIQTTVYNIIKGNATVLALNPKVVDGIPYTAMTKGLGFPYIIVPIAKIAENPLTFSKKKIAVVVSVSIFSRKAGNIRSLADAIRKAMTDNESTTVAGKLYNLKIVNGTTTTSIMADSKPIYEFTLDLNYEWRGASWQLKL